MKRGWLCLWRKVEDNISWSRGIEYRGLMVTVLQQANWKPGFFMGHPVKPGQFPTSAGNLGNELKISRQKCQRMVSKLAEDGFILVENVSNKFTMITVINWEAYQEKKEVGEQQVSSRRAASEQQVGTIKQGNKETREQEEPIPPEKPGGSDPLGKFSTEIIEFVKTFNGYIDGKFSKSAPNRTDKSLVSDCNTIRLAMKVDKFSLDDIRSSLRWAHGDGFWQGQILSLSQIRVKGKDGTSKLQKIYQKSKTTPGTNQQASISFEDMMREKGHV